MKIKRNLKESAFTLSKLEDYMYANEKKIRNNMRVYGFKTPKDVADIGNYIDFASVLGIDSRLVKDVDLDEYTSYLAGFLNADSEDDDLDEMRESKQFETRNKMKLTLKEKKLVKEYAKKLVGKKLVKESEDVTAESVFNSIDWPTVWANINKIFKTKAKIEFKLKSNGSSHRVEMTSSNIISQCGIFKYAIGECRFKFFGSELSTNTSKNKFRGTIDLEYPGNSMTIGHISISQDNKIDIKLANPKTNY